MVEPSLNRLPSSIIKVEGSCLLQHSSGIFIRMSKHLREDQFPINQLFNQKNNIVVEECGELGRN
jgi:hypothetical protein